MKIVGNVYRVVNKERYPAAFIPSWEDDAPEESKSNAYLIAAAPELLEALQDITEAEDAESMVRLAERAIEKATGR